MAAIESISSETTVASASEVQKKRLMEACEEFQAILTQYLLKSMRQTVTRAEEPDQAREVYESMMDEALAKEIGKSQGSGLAMILYQQLLPALEGGPPDDSA